MNYEEKYKNALERARDLMTKQNPPAFNNDLISLVFPELAESEDEKIRKEIIDFITSSNKYGTNERCEAWLDWLEKQGEENPIKASYTTIVETGDGGINALVKRDLFTDGCYGEKNSSNKVGPKTLNADEVIEWLEDQACLGWIEDVEIHIFVDKFKKDFGL